MIIVSTTDTQLGRRVIDLEQPENAADGRRRFVAVIDQVEERGFGA